MMVNFLLLYVKFFVFSIKNIIAFFFYILWKSTKQDVEINGYGQNGEGKNVQYWQKKVKKL